MVQSIYLVAPIVLSTFQGRATQSRLPEKKMDEEWWERPTCIICDYGWIILLVIILGLALYFTRNIWMPLLGL